MSKITFECPDDILQTLSETPERFAEKGRLLIAVKLFELGRLSSGQAARFADMDRVVFLDALKSYQVSAINLSPEELAKELFNPEGLWEQAQPITSQDIAEVRKEMWHKFDQKG
ncbi:MAG: UPF0175 family protein [Gemmatimonadota bacterium]|nr:UPF0175 family protein [Gemmatimonadota bacterium]